MSTEPISTEALVERLFGSVLGMMDVYMVYVGDRLGFYRKLADGAAAPAELAAATGMDARYVREWLEQQAVTGFLQVEVHGDPDSWCYTLPAPYVEVFTDRDSLNYLAPFARMMVGVVRPLPAVLEAFRRGGGVRRDRRPHGRAQRQRTNVLLRRSDPPDGHREGGNGGGRRDLVAPGLGA